MFSKYISLMWFDVLVGFEAVLSHDGGKVIVINIHRDASQRAPRCRKQRLRLDSPQCCRCRGMRPRCEGAPPGRLADRGFECIMCSCKGSVHQSLRGRCSCKRFCTGAVASCCHSCTNFCNATVLREQAFVDPTGPSPLATSFALRRLGRPSDRSIAGATRLFRPRFLSLSFSSHTRLAECHSWSMRMICVDWLNVRPLKACRATLMRINHCRLIRIPMLTILFRRLKEYHLWFQSIAMTKQLLGQRVVFAFSISLSLSSSLPPGPHVDVVGVGDFMYHEDVIRGTSAIGSVHGAFQHLLLPFDLV